MEWACVNNAVKDFNKKLRKHLKAYDNLKMIEVENLRELYTNHGLHLNGIGNESLANKIVKVTNNILNGKKLVPIERKWKEEEIMGSS
jgi:hypothetical protein